VDFLKYAASSELGAVHYNQILTALDGIKLCGEVDNRKVITELTKYCKEIEGKIDELQQRLDTLGFSK
jgi:hypothetical protein